AGQITGGITYKDATTDGDSFVEHPATDVRIVATGDRDTFSELNGHFLLSDLPPGVYELHVDPTTFLQGYVPTPATIRVQVNPGKSSDVHFQLMIPPRPVIEKELPVQQGLSRGPL